MSDYYNDNNNQRYNGYGSYPQPSQPPQPPQAPQVPQQPQIPHAPQQPQQPPQAPPMRPPFNPTPPPSYTPQYNSAPPAPPAPPQAPVMNTSPYNQPQQAPAAPQYQTPNTPPQPPKQTYNASPYAPSYPPKRPMGAGLKALLIIIITILFVSLFGFIAYVALSSGGSSGFKPSTTEATTVTESIPYSSYSIGDETEETTEPTTGSYEQSDAKDKTDKDYKGLKLNKKPKKVSADKKGSSYAFSKVEKSVVGLIMYVDGQKGTSKSYTKMGTGIIISSDGYIVTNAHLTNYSRTAYLYKVITGDNKEYKAGVVGYDSRSDLAVLKIDAKNLTPASFGDSSQIKVTEDVIVVGNPLSMNYQNSVTKGIVSAVDRQVSIMNNAKCIQTDAAINPGNSGGPLCNMYGQVIGITNSKIALDDYEGMGFAIPSKLTKSVVDDIIKYGYVKGRVKIGILGEVNYIDSYSLDTAIEIKEINKGGPLEGTKAKVGDFITKIDGKKISNFSDIYTLLAKYKEGDKVKVTCYRPSTEKSFDIEITLQADKS